MRRRPERLPTLVMAVSTGAVCVWLLFDCPLPVIAAIALLLGSVAEYLLPTTYRIDTEGVSAHNAISDLRLKWSDAHRCLSDPHGILVTPLRVASRLDRFRGVLLRYAPVGEPGDQSSVFAAIAAHASILELPATHSDCTAADAQTQV